MAEADKGDSEKRQVLVCIDASPQAHNAFECKYIFYCLSCLQASAYIHTDKTQWVGFSCYWVSYLGDCRNTLLEIFSKFLKSRMFSHEKEFGIWWTVSYNKHKVRLKWPWPFSVTEHRTLSLCIVFRILCKSSMVGQHIQCKLLVPSLSPLRIITGSHCFKTMISLNLCCV